MDKDDKAFFIGTILAPLIVWWCFYGRKKFGFIKGMR